MADTALVLLARSGDELAFRRLLDQHQDVIRFNTARYFAPGLDRDDFHQEALHGFHKAVRDYKDGPFRPFAKLCVERQVITAVKTARRRKHSPLNDASSLSAPVGDGEESTLGDLLADPGSSDPLAELQAKEAMQRLTDAVGDLTPLERRALIGISGGDSYETIAAAAAVDFKSIDNAVQRARKKVAAALASPSSTPSPSPAEPPVPRRPPLRRRRQSRRSLVVHPLPVKEAHPVPSIVESVEAEISTVQEEIAALEQQLDGKRIHLEGLNDLRARAEALATGTAPAAAKPEPEPRPLPPAPRQPSSPSPERFKTDAKRIEAIVKLVAERAGGVSAGEIRRELHLSENQFRALRHRLSTVLRAEGEGRARRYFPKESTDRPSPAPAPQRRAAPARKSHARRNTEAAEAHNALREQVKAAILDLLAKEPMGSDRLNAAVLERVPEATPKGVTTVRTKLMSETGQIEIRANKFCLSGVDRTKPITAVEKEVVGALGSGRTAREVAANCELVRNAFTARTVLAALVQRGVIAERPDSDPVVYEAIAEWAEAA